MLEDGRTFLFVSIFLVGKKRKKKEGEKGKKEEGGRERIWFRVYLGSVG